MDPADEARFAYLERSVEELSLNLLQELQARRRLEAEVAELKRRLKGLAEAAESDSEALAADRRPPHW